MSVSKQHMKEFASLITRMYKNTYITKNVNETRDELVQEFLSIIGNFFREFNYRYSHGRFIEAVREDNGISDIVITNDGTRTVNTKIRKANYGITASTTLYLSEQYIITTDSEWILQDYSEFHNAYRLFIDYNSIDKKYDLHMKIKDLKEYKYTNKLEVMELGDYDE